MAINPLMLPDETGFMRSSSVDDGGALFGDSFEAHVQRMMKANGPVFACITARQMPFSEARFQFQEVRDGKPGKLVGDLNRLNVLASPWPGGTTGDLLSRMEQDASLAGNFFAVRHAGGLRRLRPDWVRVVSAVVGDSNSESDDFRSEVVGYIYDPPKSASKLFAPSQIVHYAPIPDPESPWRGMSWLTPLIREVEADELATAHKLGFFRNGAALSTAIAYSPEIKPDDFKRYVEMFEAAHAGSKNAFKTLHIGGGADVTAIGTELKTDFKAVQGAGETRIAAASGVGAIMARFSEGLAGSSLNAGNYSAAKRQFADMTLRPLWRSAAEALTTVVDVPAGMRLWYDVSDVEFLKDDRKDAAEIRKVTAETVKSLTDAGFTPESVIEAVESDDMSRLVHSGLYSVQLRPGGSAVATVDPAVINALGILVRSGYEPEAACVAMGLDPIKHTGLLPVTVQGDDPTILENNPDAD